MMQLSARLPEPLVRMATNSGWLFTRAVLRLAVGFITAVWLARYLGPESFGLYSYVVAFVMIFVGVSSFGMVTLVTRELVERPDASNRILGSALAIRCMGSLAAASVLLVLAVLLHPELDQRVALIVFGVVILVQPLDVLTQFYEARTQSRYVVWVQLVAAALYLVFVAAFIYLELGVVWFLFARLGEAVLAQVGVLVVFAAQGHKPTQWRLDPGHARRMVTEAWPLALAAIGAVLYLRVDQVMLGQLSDAYEVGIYAAAARLSEVWYFIPGLIVASAFPYLVQLRSRDRVSYATRLQHLYDILAWLGLAVAFVIAVSSPWLVSLLYGDEFAESSVILTIHVWAGVFVFLRAAFSRWLIAERLPMFSLVTQGTGALVNILLNFALIPLWGGIGAAWATVISYAVAGYIVLWLFRATRPSAVMMTRTIGAPVRLLQSGRAHA